MHRNVSAWSIRQPVPALVLFMVLIALGLVSFGELPITRFPNIDVPIVQVRITQAGAAPSELEVQVTKKVEDAIAGVNGIKHQTSAVTEGSSITTIEFRLEANQDRALNDVKDAVSRIRAELPRTIDEPIVTRVEIEGLPIVTYGARAPGKTPEKLSWFVDDVVLRALQGVRGVSQIERFAPSARSGSPSIRTGFWPSASPPVTSTGSLGQRTSIWPAVGVRSAGASRPFARSPASSPCPIWPPP